MYDNGTDVQSMGTLVDRYEEMMRIKARVRRIAQVIKRDVSKYVFLPRKERDGYEECVRQLLKSEFPAHYFEVELFQSPYDNAIELNVRVDYRMIERVHMEDIDGITERI